MSEPRRLAEIRVTLQRVPPGERAVAGDHNESLGLRTKLGGEPDWIQYEETPTCPHCGRLMPFVAQIDSVEHDSDHNPLRRNCLDDQDYMFGDVGMIYVFFCYDCCQPASVHQCY